MFYTQGQSGGQWECPADFVQSKETNVLSTFSSSSPSPTKHRTIGGRSLSVDLQARQKIKGMQQQSRDVPDRSPKKAVERRITVDVVSNHHENGNSTIERSSAKKTANKRKSGGLHEHDDLQELNSNMRFLKFEDTLDDVDNSEASVHVKFALAPENAEEDSSVFVDVSDNPYLDKGEISEEDTGEDDGNIKEEIDIERDDVGTASATVGNISTSNLAASRGLAEFEQRLSRSPSQSRRQTMDDRVGPGYRNSDGTNRFPIVPTLQLQDTQRDRVSHNKRHTIAQARSQSQSLSTPTSQNIFSSVAISSSLSVDVENQNYAQSQIDENEEKEYHQSPLKIFETGTSSSSFNEDPEVHRKMQQLIKLSESGNDPPPQRPENSIDTIKKKFATLRAREKDIDEQVF